MADPRIRDGRLVPEVVRGDFPILGTTAHGKPLVYLDSAATSQKPLAVIEALDSYYRTYNANVHRGIYDISERATAAYEGARGRIAGFINSPESPTLINVRNATEAINLVAYAWGRANVREGDLLVATELEHHANLVPWQLLAAERKARLEFIPITDEGIVRQDVYEQLLAQRPRLVAFTHVSNTLGTINPVAEMTAKAHAVGALVLVDGAQAVPHLPVDVQALGVDFYVFSGHKMLGPTGIGVLWGRFELLDAMQPFLGGGDMILTVSMERSTWAEVPAKFEAGTPNIADAIGLGAAVDSLAALGMDAVRRHEVEITDYALRRLADVPGVTIFGPMDAEQRGGVVSFELEGVHPHDVGQVLDTKGVAIRTGHHCAQPVMAALQVPATARASFYIYNTTEEVDTLASAIESAAAFFGGR